MKENMGQMNKDDKDAVAAVFTSVKEIRRVAQLNYKALTRVRNVMMKYPPLDFLVQGDEAYRRNNATRSNKHRICIIDDDLRGRW